MASATAHMLMVAVVLAVASATLPLALAREAPPPTAGGTADWVWCTDPAIGASAAPTNTFVYYRAVFTPPPSAVRGLDGGMGASAAMMRFAADSNAALYLNGAPLRLKTTRFKEADVTAEVITAARVQGILKAGVPNTLVIVHFSWGPITTFQRTGEAHAGVWLSAPEVGATTSNSSQWRCLLAPQHFRHDQQVVGIAGNAHRIRFPQVVDGRKVLQGDIFSPHFDDASWHAITAVPAASAPWPATVPDVETPGAAIGPGAGPKQVVAAGRFDSPVPLNLSDAWNMAERVMQSSYTPDATRSAAAQRNVTNGLPLWFSGGSGATSFVTVDFWVPRHGYPRLVIRGAPEGAVIDLCYTEKALDLYSGDAYVKPTGWLNPIGIVGHGYGDRYIASDAAVQEVQMPDERTSRWLVVQVTFPAAASTAGTAAAYGFSIELSITEIGFPVAKPVGTFASGDATLDGLIVPLAMEHLTVSMSDTLVDTPGREDGQWIEDARPRANIASRVWGDGTLRRVLVRQMAEEQFAGGGFFPFPPSNFPVGPAAYDWAVQWVAALHDDFMWRNDIGTIRANWDALVAFWDNCLAHLNRSTGLWETSSVLADLRVGVHCPNSSCVSGIVTPWIIQRLRWSATMAGAAGNSSVQQAWTSAASLMTAGFRKRVLVPAAGGVPAHVPDIVLVGAGGGLTPQGYSQAGQTVAVFAGGLLTQEEALADLEHAFPAPQGSPPPGLTRWNNPTYMYRALTALTHAGMSTRAVAHLKERYSQYLPNSTDNPVPAQFQGPHGGPLPEYWVSRVDMGLHAGQIDTAQPVDGSGSHGWCGVAVLWLHEALLGVTLASPGGALLALAPDRGGLPYVCGATATPMGVVDVCWHKTPGALSLTLPAGTSAALTTPPSCTSGEAASASAGTSAGPRASAGTGSAGAAAAGHLVVTQQPAAGAATPTAAGFNLSQAGSYSFKCVTTQLPLRGRA